MKTLIAYIYYCLIRFLLSLRYRIRVKGLNAIAQEKLPHSTGILFLANHPAEIDPCILLRVLWPKFRARPVAIDYLFRKLFVGYLLELIGALPIPNFDNSSNSFKRRQINQTYARIFNLLDQNENLLIYPAGGLKNNAEEVIGGASGIHNIVQKKPEINVVLVRTTGLWGSHFSRALTGKTPDLGKAFFHGFKVLLKNGLFFAPRREVIVEFTLAPDDFPRQAGRLELNRYLENWYNSPAPEPLNLVSYSFWKKDLPKPFARPQEEELSIADVPIELKTKILDELSSLTKMPVDALAPNLDLATDLGLDSLDISQLVVLLKEEFGVLGVQSTDLTTVGSVLVYAARLKKGEAETEEEEEKTELWSIEKDRPLALYPKGETLPEVFLKTCDRLGNRVACVDRISGEVTYKRLKMGVILLAQAIGHLPGERIGIMMPASVAVNAVILATLLAGKVPVMINWTLGERNLRSIVEQSKIQATLSSWSFLDRLENVDLNGLDDQIVLLEDMRRDFTLFDKLKAFLWARKKPRALLQAFGTHTLSKEQTAVILFTSGTESVPKGVPLSHHNIMSNQRDAYQCVEVEHADVFLGCLPPFHSFGFSVTGLFPLLAGLPVAYSPNPTDGRRIALALNRWRVTLLCMAPTFLKNLLRVAAAEQLRFLRLVVSGAEKAPSEVFEKMEELNPKASVVEGYGITECGPILTITPPSLLPRGVGKALPSVELLIVHPETHTPLQPGESGLILARGPNIFDGYLDATLLRPFVTIEGKEWYVTGDLGYLDTDGYLTLSGRLKRFVKIGGEMVSLASVEEALLQFASEAGWELDAELPSLAICAIEQEGKKSEMHLFTVFDTTVDLVNQALRKSGMSNLIKIRTVQKVPFIPVLGSGKIDYRKLSGQITERT
ncbi:MAG: Bifunctional protein Aas [Chlamydiales bacterium]|nr:Bifunctional protein Aas [Chlamydiales bacterium]